MKDEKSEVNTTSEGLDPVIKFMFKMVSWNVKILAFLMVFVIWWASADVVYQMYRKFFESESRFFDIDELITLLGCFLGVLIAIEIFLNIIFYLKEDEIHVPLVIATALTAISRKIIVFEYTKLAPLALVGIAAIIFALGLTYWLITVKSSPKK